jgi:hypothetical protein
VTLEDCYDEYDHLLTNFASLRAEAAVPAEDGDEYVRFACVGFSVHGPRQGWRESHATLITNYVRACQAQGDPERVLLFYALSHGLILGAYASGLLDDETYRKAWILLPGYVMGKTREIQA